MKSILLHVYGDSEFPNRLAVAISAARAYDAHLSCVQVTPFDTYVAFDMLGGVAIPQSLFDEVDAQAQALQVETEAKLVAAGVRWDWRAISGDPATVLIHHAALSDLVVVSQGASGRGLERPLPVVDLLALNAGCPTLVVPAGNAAYDAAAPVVIGWNGSDEAARALRQTLPVLRAAGAVHIVAIGADEDDVSAISAKHYLAQHGVSSEVHLLPASRNVADRLQDCAQDMKAGAVVIGAYGHSRLREALLGGVTEQLIRECPLPLFLAR